jgi:hypothetical protein
MTTVHALKNGTIEIRPSHRAGNVNLHYGASLSFSTAKAEAG